MDNAFAKAYRNKVFHTHIIVTSIILLVILFLYLFFDFVTNGFITSLLNLVFGRFSIITSFITNRYIFIPFLTVLSVFIGWVVVEGRALRKLSAAIGDMKNFFKSNSEHLTLDKDFQEIAGELNSFKLASIKNEQRAQMETQRKNDLITYLAHDIKTPLTSVIGYLSLLDEAKELPAMQRQKYIKITLDKAYRLEALVNEFFDITRFNLSTIPLEKEVIDLKLMLMQLADEFYPILAPGGKTTLINVPDGLSIYADPDKLARVFNNILKNAATYSTSNSIIEITAKSDIGAVEVVFKNKGTRIPEEKLRVIFEKFYRLDASRSTNTGGSGLGLAIAKEIVKAHGGSINATSVEEYTVFTVTLPIL